MAKNTLTIVEIIELYAMWDRGTFLTVEESVDYHHLVHGAGRTRWEYLQLAAEFDRANARRMERSDKSIKFTQQNGEFLIEKGGKILSYGPPRS